MKNNLRIFFRHLLHDHRNIGSQLIDGLIAFLIIISCALIPLHLFPYFSALDEELLMVETFIVLIFTIEFALRFWSAKNPFKYMFSWIGIIDLLAIVPFYFELLGILPQMVEVLIFMRVARIIKLFNTYYLERKSISNSVTTQHGSFKTMEGEYIDTIIQKHPMIFIGSLIPVFIFTSISVLILSISGTLNVFSIAGSAIFFLLAVLIFIKDWLDFHYDVIYVTNYQVVVQNRHLFGVERNRILYHVITHVHPDTKGLMKSIFRFGDVTIETATTSNEKIRFTYAHDVEKIVRIVAKHQRNSIYKQRKEWKTSGKSSEKIQEERGEIKKEKFLEDESEIKNKNNFLPQVPYQTQNFFQKKQQKIHQAEDVNVLQQNIKKRIVKNFRSQ